MYGFNTEKLLMLMKFQTVMMQYIMFGMYTTFRKFSIEKTVNPQISLLMKMIEER